VTRILTAVAPDAEERVRRILTGHELHFVNDLGAAKAALENDRIALIFVGARFDESRMFDLLDYLRKDAQHKKIPIVAAIVAPTSMTAETVGGLAHTTKIFGARVFVNLNDFSDDEVDNTRIRIIVEAIILPADHVPVAAEKLAHKPGGGAKSG
jgi:CheY-like chemotaxis protein